MRAYYPHPLVKYDKRCKYGYLFLNMQTLTEKFLIYILSERLDGYN